MVVGFITTYAYHYELLNTTLCDKACQWLTAGLWFSPGTPVSSTNKTDRHDITEILLKVALKYYNPNPSLDFTKHGDILFFVIPKQISGYYQFSSYLGITGETSSIFNYILGKNKGTL